MCDVQRFRFLVAEPLIILPYAVRASRIWKSLNIVQNLKNNSRKEVILKSLVSMRIFFVCLMIICVVTIILIIISISAPHIQLYLASDMTRSCKKAFHKPSDYFLINFILAVIYFLVQVGFVAYFLFRIRKLSPKYRMK